MNRPQIFACAALLLLSCLVPGKPAVAAVNVEASCNGEDFLVTVGVINLYTETDFVGVAVTRQTLGTCEEEVLVTAEPIPLPEFAGDGWANMVFTQFTTEMPQADLHFVFRAYLVDDLGNRYTDFLIGQIYPFPEPYDYAACGEAVIMRGTLSLLGGGGSTLSIAITPCSDGCWGVPEPFFIAEVGQNDPLVSLLYQVVDLYGTRIENDGMLHPEPYVITDVQPAPDGVCGPVPSNDESWGGVKAMYR